MTTENTDRSPVLAKTSALSRMMFSVLGLICLLMGCGGPQEKKELYSVKGQLFINGKPGEDAWVMLVPDDEGVPSPMGKVEKDGSFQMVVYDQDVAKFPKPGNPVGDYHVMIFAPKDPSKPLFQDRFGGAFADPKRFEHVVSIDTGENALDPIKIENAQYVN